VEEAVRLGIHIPAHGRHELLRRVLEQLGRCGCYWTVVAGDYDPGPDLADLFAPVSNHNLANKFNVSCQLLRGARVDGCMVLGSDDMVDAGYLLGVCRLLEQGFEYIGTTDAYSYTEATGKWHYLDRAKVELDGEKVDIGDTVDAGRCLSKSALEACDWTPWMHSTSRSGMGSLQERRMRQAYPHAKRWAGTLAELGGMRIGIKQGEAISDISRLGVEVEPTQEQKELIRDDNKRKGRW
jgi:hypothetical protein